MNRANTVDPGMFWSLVLLQHGCGEWPLWAGFASYTISRLPSLSQNSLQKCNLTISAPAQKGRPDANLFVSEAEKAMEREHYPRQVRRRPCTAWQLPTPLLHERATDSVSAPHSVTRPLIQSVAKIHQEQKEQAQQKLLSRCKRGSSGNQRQIQGK